MKPPIYGYMRVTDDMSDEEVMRTKERLRAYAEAGGFTLEAVFYENMRNPRAAFDELVEALQRTKARHVVVPSFRDFAVTEALQNAMLVRIEFTTDAQVLELGESS